MHASKDRNVTTELIELKVRKSAYKRHIDTLLSVQPIIDTSKPAVVPRIIRWNKRLTYERQIQFLDEEENLRMLREMKHARDVTRAAALRPNSSASRRNWMDELPETEKELDMVRDTWSEKRRPSTTSRPFAFVARPATEPNKKVIQDDGMTVIDESPRRRTHRLIRPVMQREQDRCDGKVSGRAKLGKLEPLANEDDSNRRSRKGQRGRRHTEGEVEEFGDGQCLTDEDVDVGEVQVLNEEIEEQNGEENGAETKVGDESVGSFEDEEDKKRKALKPNYQIQSLAIHSIAPHKRESMSSASRKSNTKMGSAKEKEMQRRRMNSNQTNRTPPLLLMK